MQVIYDAMLQDENSRPGLSALAVSVETYHQQIEAAKDSQKLLLGTIDDIVKGRLTTFSRERYSDQQSIYVEHMIESGTQPPFCRSREDQGPVLIM